MFCKPCYFTKLQIDLIELSHKAKFSNQLEPKWFNSFSLVTCATIFIVLPWKANVQSIFPAIFNSFPEALLAFWDLFFFNYWETDFFHVFYNMIVISDTVSSCRVIWILFMFAFTYFPYEATPPTTKKN